MLKRRDSAPEIHQRYPRVGEVALGGVIGEIAVGDAQCRCDLQERTVLKRLVGAARVGRRRGGDILAGVEPHHLTGLDLQILVRGSSGVSGAGEVMNIANIAAVFLRSSSASS